VTEPLFRDEALEYLARQHGPGELIDQSNRWLEAVYWAFLLLVAVGAIAAVFVPMGGVTLLQRIYG
jgi:hypothetical protein